MAVMDNIYDKFIIVDEKMITDLSTKKYCTAGCIDVCSCRHINSEFRDRTAFAELEFTMSNRTLILQIKDAVASHPTLGSGPMAQIVSWKWAWGAQQIEKPIILDRGQTTWIRCNDSPSIVIRSLKKREVIENPCPPLSSPDDDLTVHIGDHQVTVSAHWLMVVSPVVKRMLSVEMREKQQRALNLDGHDITMEQFMQFLETINDHLQHGRTLPNPTNVLALLKLADHFQMDWLKERCEAHLINCVEIPLIERFLLIDRYRLNTLKKFFLRFLNVDSLREFIKVNGHRLTPASIGQEFLLELTFRLCDKQTEATDGGCFS